LTPVVFLGLFLTWLVHIKNSNDLDLVGREPSSSGGWSVWSCDSLGNYSMLDSFTKATVRGRGWHFTGRGGVCSYSSPCYRWWCRIQCTSQS